MPIAYQFNQALNMLEVLAVGHISVADRALFVATDTDDPNLPAQTPVLIDVSRIVNAPSIDDLPQMARLVERLVNRFKLRIAHFVTQVGIVTPYVLTSTEVDERPSQSRAFTDRREAIEWLSVC